MTEQTFHKNRKKVKKRRALLTLWRYVRKFITFKIKVALSVLILFLFLFIALLLPETQTYLGNKGGQWFTEKTGFPCTIDKIHITPLGKIYLNGVVINDRTNQGFIKADTLVANFSWFDVIKGERLKFSYAKLNGGLFQLNINPQSEELNINEFLNSIDSLSGYDPNAPPSPKAYDIIFDTVRLENTRFVYNNHLRDSLEQGLFDYYHFEIGDIRAKAYTLKIHRDTVTVSIDHISGVQEDLQWPIFNLTTDFDYCNKHLKFNNFNLYAGQSNVKDTLWFQFDNPSEMADFNEKVNIYANFISSQISTSDLAIFAPSLKQYQEDVAFSGILKGKVKNLKTENISLHLAGGNSTFNGNVSFRGLPDVENTSILLKLKNSHLDVNDFSKYLTESQRIAFKKLGYIRYDGEFSGFTTDFVAKGTFHTDLGEIISDINLKTDKETYAGHLTLNDFDLGKWIDESHTLGKVSLKGSIEQGKGFRKENADFILDAQIEKLELKKYTYKNGKVQGRFKDNFFEGMAALTDPNLIFQLDGKVNLNDSMLAINGSLIHSRLELLGLTEQQASIQSDFVIRSKGFDPDRISGLASFQNFRAEYNNNFLELDSILLSATLMDELRIWDLNCDLLHADIQGKFSVKEFLHRFSDNMAEYTHYLASDSLALATTMAESVRHSTRATDSIDVDFLVEFKDVSPVVRLFLPDFYMGKTNTFTGKIRSGSQDFFRLRGGIDTLRFGSTELRDINCDFWSNKPFGTAPIIAKADINAYEMDISGSYQPENISFTAELEEKNIAFHTFFNNSKTKDTLDVVGNFCFEDTFQRITVFPNTLFALEQAWTAPDTFIIHWDGLEVGLQKPLELVSGIQYFKVEGGVSEHADSALFVSLENFDLQYLSSMVGVPVSGQAGFYGSLKDVYGELKLNSSLLAEGVYLDTFLLGKVEMLTLWDPSYDRISVNGEIRRKNRKILDLSGFYNYKDLYSPLSIDAQLMEFELNLIQPFLAGVLSDIKGKGFGAIKIKGPVSAPALIGEAFVVGGQFRVDYLNTLYRFEDKIVIEENNIGFDRMRLRDERENVAFIDGGLYHDGFKHFIIQLRSEFDYFQVLNTNPSHNELFYGEAYGTGKMELFGPINDLELNVEATTEKGSKLSIPLDTYEAIQERSYIYYTPPDSLMQTDSAKYARHHSEEDLNMKIHLNLEITPEAHGEIIFDKKAGDVIRANGKGKIEMNIDLNGEFTMFGGIEMVQGAYNFTFLNVVNKEFGIKPGSLIVWDGNPYEAKLNIEATYTQMASLSPIIYADSSITNRPEIRRKYPVMVSLFLRGNLLSPDISFDINFPDYPKTVVAGGVPISVDGHVAAFKSRIMSDEQELNRQVFSLIILKKLSAENTFQGINQSAGGSVSELITNQLSYWMSQVDDNLEIDVDLNGLTPEALSAVQLRLSYSFMNGKFRITREGAFTNVQNTANVSSIAGDWTLEYIISADGRLRLKVFHRNNLSAFGTASQSSSTAGAGLMYALSFDSFKEAFRKIFKKKKQNHVFDNEIFIK